MPHVVTLNNSRAAVEATARAGRDGQRSPQIFLRQVAKFFRVCEKTHCKLVIDSHRIIGDKLAVSTLIAIDDQSDCKW